MENEDQVRQAAEFAVRPKNAGFPHLPRPEATSGIAFRIGDTAADGGAPLIQ